MVYLIFLIKKLIEMKFLIKYLSLITLFLILISQTQLYVDFTASRSNIIILPILTILVILNVIVIYFYDLENKIKTLRTTLILSFLIILFGINLLLNYRQSKKQVHLKFYVSNNFLLKQIGYEVKLYQDKTFEINEYWHGESRHYFGEYILEDDQLSFIDENIEEKTDYQITKKYQLDDQTQQFKALEKGFQNLKPR